MSGRGRLLSWNKSTASRATNQPNRFPPAQPMCAAAATTTNKQQCSTKLSSCNQSWQLPTPVVASQLGRRTSITLQQQQQRVRDQVWSSGILLLRRLLLRCPRRRSFLVPAGRWHLRWVCRRRMVRMDRRRSAAEADGARHRLRPVLEPRLHLVGAVTYGYPKTKNCTR